MTTLTAAPASVFIATSNRPGPDFAASGEILTQNQS
jgi:hypothetical protein